MRQWAGELYERQVQRLRELPRGISAWVSRGNHPSAGPTVIAAPAQSVKVSMREFLRSGAFGPLKVGATREQVRATLGEPDDWSIPSRRQRLPAKWKYGVVEFHFDPGTDTIYLIHADDFEHLHAGAAIDFHPWWMHAT
jgi:hypothetical protein